MSVKKIVKKITRSISLAAICLFAILLGPFAPGSNLRPASASEPQPLLVITGTGLEQDIYLYEADLAFNNPRMVEYYYSSNNNWDFKSILKVRGFDLLELLDQYGEGNLKEGDWPLTFISRDGLVIPQLLPGGDYFPFPMTISTLQERYYYSDLTLASEERVDPMIGIYRASLYNNNNPQPPVSWDDRELTEGDMDNYNNPPLRLYFGQARGNIEDRNQPFFNRELIRIVVGAERPHYFPGNVNGDQGIDVGDAILVLRHIVGLVALNADQQEAADVNLNGNVEVGDAILILRHIVGLVETLPVSGSG